MSNQHGDRLSPPRSAVPQVPSSACGSLRLVAWNVGHRTQLREMHPRFGDAIAVLDADLLVLNEYVHDDECRASMLDRLRALGLIHWKVSEKMPQEDGRQGNQVFIASRLPLHVGSIRGPVMFPDRGGESNFLHVRVGGLALEVVGMRAPAYETAESKRRYWSEFGAIASEAAGRPIVFLGDMNADPDSARSIGGSKLASLRDVGWHLPGPDGSQIFVTGSRIDHVLAWRVLPEPTARYVASVGDIQLMGAGQAAISDHAALVVEFPWMPRLRPPASFPPEAEADGSAASERLPSWSEST